VARPWRIRRCNAFLSKVSKLILLVIELFDYCIPLNNNRPYPGGYESNEYWQ